MAGVSSLPEAIQTTPRVTDSRKLRYYYRFLPEKRLQIGIRSAISGADAENIKRKKVLHDASARKLPALENLEIPWFCHGWMDISHDIQLTAAQTSIAADS